MKRLAITATVLLFVALVAPGAMATTFTMFESAFNVDGNIISTFQGDFTSAITYQITFITAGNHYGAVYVDPEIDEAANTFFNEYGETNGTPAAGQSWEIDEPGFVFGDIYTNFVAGTLDNKLFDGTFNGPEDVAMALGWDFILASGETATATYVISPDMPTSGFYLVQNDPDSGASLYFSSTLTTGVIPEPSTLLLLGPALGVLALLRKRIAAK